MAARLRAEGRTTLVVSGDRDLLQLAFGSVRVHFVGRRGKDALDYDEAGVRERFGVPPWRLPSFVALVGDAIRQPARRAGALVLKPPKVAGDSRRRGAAAELRRSGWRRLASRRYCSNTPSKIRATEALARLRIDAPLPPPPYCKAPTRADFLRLRELFEALEFKSLQPRLDKLLLTA